MRIFHWLSVLCVALLAIAGVFACSSTQTTMTPAVEVSPDPAINRVLAQSCYSCHSNEALTWYAKLQPSRWFGNSALEDLNFSDWQSYSAGRRKDAIRQIASAVDSDAMPPAGYLLFHQHARLDPEQKAAIDRWAAANGAAVAH
jgi:hypothetical protein